MDKEKVIPIFFTIDNSYAAVNGVAVKSLIENASKDYNYKIIIIHENLNSGNMKKIADLATENCEIEFRPIQEGLETITDRTENKLRCDYFTLTIYFRLFIADMFPEYDKGIYLDSDIVVPGDISELYNKDLGNNIIGACCDNSIQEIPELINWMENSIGVKKQEYINSGILLLNLKMMRERKFSKKFLELLNKFHFDCLAPDQDYINAMCNGKILYLEEEWDTMPNRNKEKLKSPKLIHYNLFDKPWCYDDIQYEEYFWKYAKETAFYDEILEFKKNYPEEQKLSDKNSLAKIIHKGATLTEETDNTFKKKFEAGEYSRI